MKDVNDVTKSLGLTTRLKSTRSFKSSKSRQSLAGGAFHFNPLRFLAMGLIEKNQERKE